MDIQSYRTTNGLTLDPPLFQSLLSPTPQNLTILGKSNLLWWKLNSKFLSINDNLYESILVRATGSHMHGTKSLSALQLANQIA